MTTREHTKLDLMIFAINSDFFGYGSSCKKRSNGYYIAIVDEETYIFSGKELASQWDNLDKYDQKSIIAYFAEKELGLN